MSRSVEFDIVEQLMIIHFGDLGSVTLPDISFGFLDEMGASSIEDINHYTQGLYGYDMIIFT